MAGHVGAWDTVDTIACMQVVAFRLVLAAGEDCERLH